MVTVVTASDLVNVSQLNFIASQEEEAKVMSSALPQVATTDVYDDDDEGVLLQVWCEDLFSLSSNLLSYNLNRDHSLLKG